MQTCANVVDCTKLYVFSVFYVRGAAKRTQRQKMHAWVVLSMHCAFVYVCATYIAVKRLAWVLLNPSLAPGSNVALYEQSRIFRKGATEQQLRR